MELVEKLQLKRRISEIHVNVFTRKWMKVFRILTVGMMLWVICFTPLQMAGQATSTINYNELMPTPTKPSGADVYQAIYRGIKRNDLPNVPDQVADPIYQQWSTMAEIYSGLSLLQKISALNPNSTSLMAEYIGNNTKDKFIQTVFTQRTNATDLWWGSLNKTVEAATIFQELGVMNYTIGQLDEALNYNLQLANYYSAIAPNNITVDKITVPGWTALTLKDLLTYRVTSYLSTKKISFQEGSTDYYDSLAQAINLGLVTMREVGLTPLTNAIIDGRNKASVQIVNGLNQQKEYSYISSNYSLTENGTTGHPALSIPTKFFQFLERQQL